MEDVQLPAEGHSPSLHLVHLPPLSTPLERAAPAVLFIHGATFPTALAAGYRIDGVSWMDALAAAGFDVWGLDFAGYGGSERYPEMVVGDATSAPRGRAPEAAEQIGRAVEEIRRRRGPVPVSIIAHSWGTVPAGLFTELHSQQVCRLVLFGALAPGTTPLPDSASWPAYEQVTVAQQRASFRSGLPAGGEGLFAANFEAWAVEYLRSDPTSGGRRPPSVRVPFGPLADHSLIQAGRLPYRPERITVPVLLIHGDLDQVSTRADNTWLFTHLTGSLHKRDVVIGGGAHRMHLEVTRSALFGVTLQFLKEDLGTQGGGCVP